MPFPSDLKRLRFTKSNNLCLVFIGKSSRYQREWERLLKRLSNPRMNLLPLRVFTEPRNNQLIFSADNVFHIKTKFIRTTRLKPNKIASNLKTNWSWHV